MARIESVALGGFYATPPHLVPLMARVLECDTEQEYTVADPCAGEGLAILSLIQEMGLGKGTTLYTCELEQERYGTLTENLTRDLNWAAGNRALHGDAFQIPIKDDGIDLLYLNPPYDQDPQHGRLEEKFLHRFTQIVETNGVLVLVVPYYALKASANTLATHYQDLICLKFPEPDFGAYKQVVLYARKRDSSELLGANPKVLRKVEGWAADHSKIKVLGQTNDRIGLPERRSYFSYSNWVLAKLDLTGLIERALPWQQSARLGVTVPVPHILPDTPVEDLMFRSYRVATAPRPAHIATGIASGLFNGRRITAEGKPDLLVKGVFDREFVTVEEKVSRDGDTVSCTQVQQPKLVVTVLDLTTNQYSTLNQAGIEQLLVDYGPSLMQVMALQCPVQYSPVRDAQSLPLLSWGRPLYDAQTHAAKAILSLLGGVGATRAMRRNKAAILLGEIGSGKTSVALTVANTIARRVLVMCPPHLLTGWKDEARKVAPDAVVHVLEDLTDVDELAASPTDHRMVIGILSRETAKLSHGYEAVTGSCPRCGAALPEQDVVKKRLRCENRRLYFKDQFAQASRTLAFKMAPYGPKDYRVEKVLQGRALQRYLGHIVPRDPSGWSFDRTWVQETLEALLAKPAGIEPHLLVSLVAQLLLADYQPKQIEALIESTAPKKNYDYSPTTILPRELKALLEPRGENDNTYYHYLSKVEWVDGRPVLDGVEAGSFELAGQILESLARIGKYKYGKPCGEILYQAVPKPRRYGLAKYIVRRFPKMFDLFVMDECHEASTDGSAQEKAAHAIASLGIPSIFMTGSIMNGYAKSLFTNMWYLSEDFRSEFARDDGHRFVDRYGYRKRVLTEKDRGPREVVEYGSQTDRVVTSARMIGDAPGVLPLFLFRHLLGISVTLHKADLALDLPPCRHIRHEIEPSPELLASYQNLKSTLARQILQDRWEEGKAGKLFGALSELPSYLDRATLDTGNQDSGRYEIHYPESCGGDLVAEGESYSETELSAKEQWMLDTVRAELDEGRNVMVLCWHVGLLGRMSRIIDQRLGETAPVLYASKVPTHKRQDWIDQNIVKKNRRVMVANPVGISTGLNNLVHFSTQIWMENPMANPIIFRQGGGRVDRIGQRQETRIYCPVFKNTLQVQMHDLLLRKVAVSISTDGLDAESVLLATGAMDSGYLTGMSIGKQLWSLMQEGQA